MLDLYKKPKVGEITHWVPLFKGDGVQWDSAGNHRAFYRVKPAGQRARYFYGEMAYYESRAAAADIDFGAWDWDRDV